jgi:hypothetical protein
VECSGLSEVIDAEAATDTEVVAFQLGVAQR